MDVYLKNEREKNVFHFPINPIDSITINRSKKYDTADIVDYGEVDLSDKGKKIKELSFDTLLPQQYDAYCRYKNIPNPVEIIAKLEKWMEQQEPLRLIITDFNFNDLVIITSISEEERAGETGDKYINISFRTYRQLKIETLNSPKRNMSKKSTVKRVTLRNNRIATRSNSKIYVVKPGDSLWKISKCWYGNGSKWNVIYEKNKKTIGANPNKIYSGAKVGDVMATIILRNKYKIDNLTEGIQLSEAIDGIAYTANITLIETEELKKLGISKGNNIEIYDIDFETKTNRQIFKGIIWDIDRSKKTKRLTMTCKERTIYLEESEDEYLFPSMTATQRIQRYCRDWGIIVSLVDTRIKLAKAVYRSDTILGMMLKDLKETAQKGGNLYKLRMLDKLNIIQLGSNKTTWKLETIAEDIDKKSSLEGMVTQVKVLGKQEENKKTPVTGIYKKDTSKYGTIQKLVQDEKIKSSVEGRKRANALFNTGEETVKLSGIDINSIRSGDKVSVDAKILYVIDVTHNLGSTGRMNLNLSGLDYIRRRFYSGDI